MFSGQRDFKAAIVSSSLSSHQDIIDLLEAYVDKREIKKLGLFEEELEVFHGYYHTMKPYASLNILEEALVSFRGKKVYKYDFYLLKWKPKRRTHFIVASPFSSMLADMFEVLDSEIRGRKYKKLNLDGLIDILKGDSEVAAKIVATLIRFRITGGDTVKTSQMSGVDVLNSEYFRRISKSLRGIKQVPRRIRFKYDDGAAKMTIESDNQGNYSFRLRKEGLNFPVLFKVLEILEKEGLFEDTPAYPMRPGILMEEAND